MTVKLICNSGDEGLITYMARVSSSKSQAENKNSIRLIKYLIKNKHWSPFEMVSVTVEINTTRDIGRQMLRHRSFHFQEFSQRYSSEIKFSNYRECRMQDLTNRQNSISNPSIEIENEFCIAQKQHIKLSESSYKRLIKLGIAKEQARVILPEGLTTTKMYMAGTLRDWIHFTELRMGNGTQKEHRLIATKCCEILRELYPSVFMALDEIKSDSYKIGFKDLINNLIIFIKGLMYVKPRN